MSKVQKHIKHSRKNYGKYSLDEKTVSKDPFKLFEQWFEQAIAQCKTEPHAMTLATIHGKQPTARIVLLRGFSKNGFSFFTNYNSNKGAEIKNNPAGCLLFFWHELERQVRIEGKLVKVSAKESDDYFNSRPHESKVGAWTSDQSKVIANRIELDLRYEALLKKYAGMQVPRPKHWGGYVLKPTKIEFWQGGLNRLHDRVLYSKKASGWKIERLSP